MPLLWFLRRSGVCVQILFNTPTGGASVAVKKSKMPETIHVLMDYADGQVRTTSWESLALGQRIAGEMGYSLRAVLLGQGVSTLAQSVAKHRVASVLLVQDGKLAEYDPDAHCEALCQILVEDRSHLLLMGHIYQNLDLAPKLAAKLKKGLVTDCIGYRKEGDGLIFVRRMFRNKMNADIRIRSKHPWIVTLQSGAFSADSAESGSSQVVERTIDLSGVELRRLSLETIQAVKGKADLTKAEIIVGVGRGIRKAENLKIIEALADVLGAEIGASRPVVDCEWLGREHQVGSSGQSISPRLYIACGISGAIQHIVGIRNSDCIVAVNLDPNAPIFNIATYGIVGDLLDIVPALTKKLKESKKM